MGTLKRIGIMTGGGDCPGLNAVIRAAVHRLIREYDVEVFGSEDAFNGFLETPQRIIRLELANVSGILPRGGTILGTTNRGDPFAFPVREGDETRLVDVSHQLVERIRGHDIEGLICIGGDGTLAIANRLMTDHRLPVVGVPKTIDNDVSATDVSFGFWTAVQTATQAIEMLHTTAEAHDRIMVVELMGRDAGFIALAAGLAGGADVILIPEIPYDLDVVAAKIKRRRRYGRTFSIVAVAEGAMEKGGEAITEELDDKQRAGRLRKLGGIGRWVADELGEKTGMETRVTVLGHLQRGGSPSAFDRVLATTFGVEAADAAATGRWGQMVALRSNSVVTLPLAEGIAEHRRVRPEGDWVKAARGTGVCLGDA